MPKRTRPGKWMVRTYNRRLCANGYKSSAIADVLSTSRQRIDYWKKKSTDPTFHSGPLGGDREKGTFKPYEFPIVEQVVIAFFTSNRSSRYYILFANLQSNDQCQIIAFVFEPDFYQARFKDLLLSIASPNELELQDSVSLPNTEISPDNMAKYFAFLRFIKTVPYCRIKCMDESHFVSRQINKQTVWWWKDRRAYTQSSVDLNEPSASLSLICSSDRNQVPVILDWREESNTQYDFAKFIRRAIFSDYLREGDFVLMDNAAIHHSYDSFDYVEALLRIANVTTDIVNKFRTTPKFKVFIRSTFARPTTPRLIFSRFFIFDHNDVGTTHHIGMSGEFVLPCTGEHNSIVSHRYFSPAAQTATGIVGPFPRLKKKLRRVVCLDMSITPHILVVVVSECEVNSLVDS